jgi:hypothetical protein
VLAMIRKVMDVIVPQALALQEYEERIEDLKRKNAGAESPSAREHQLQQFETELQDRLERDMSKYRTGTTP